MTDINRLISSLKRRSSHVKEFGDDITFVKIEDLDALVEALEKAQQTIAFQQGEIKALLSSLESRTVTVKLPDIMPPEAAPAHYWGSGESMAYADGYNKSAADLKTSIALSCSSAGVNVEFE